MFIKDINYDISSNISGLFHHVQTGLSVGGSNLFNVDCVGLHPGPGGRNGGGGCSRVVFERKYLLVAIIYLVLYPKYSDTKKKYVLKTLMIHPLPAYRVGFKT